MRKELIEDLRAVSETGCDPDLPFRAADLIEQLQEQLAASQAREAKLREALKMARSEAVGWYDEARNFNEHRHKHPDWLLSIDAALSQPTDDTALRELIQKAGEVMRERCAKHLENNAQALAEDYGSDDLGGLSFGSGTAADLRMDAFNGWMEDAEAIRTLPAVTLDDLNGGV